MNPIDAFLRGDFHGCIQAGKQEILNKRFSAGLYYILGLSLLRVGEEAAGYQCMKNIILMYDKYRDQGRPTQEKRRFVMWTAFQAAQFCEFALTDGREALWCYQFARQVADQTDQELIKAIDARMDRKLGERFGYIVPSRPNLLQVEPTNQCNLQCRMCPRRHMRRPLGFMEKRVFKRVLDTWHLGAKDVQMEFVNLVTGQKHRIVRWKRFGAIKLFFMGEPLLNPRLTEFVAMVRERDLGVSVQTNGVLLERNDIRRPLLRARPNTIAVSIDGLTEEGYNKVRSGSSLGRIKAGLAALRRDRDELDLEGQVNISITTIVPNDDPHWAQRNETLIGPLRPLIDHVDYVSLRTEWEPTFADGTGNMITYLGQPRGVADGHPVCTEPLHKLNVLWDGSVTPCCIDLDGKHLLGNVLEEGIDEIWTKPKTIRFQEAIINGDISQYRLCRRCLKGTLTNPYKEKMPPTVLSGQQ